MRNIESSCDFKHGLPTEVQRYTRTNNPGRAPGRIRWKEKGY